MGACANRGRGHGCRTDPDLRRKQICFETQEALFAATVNCEQLSQQLRALAADTAEQQARWRAMDAEREDQLRAMRITVQRRVDLPLTAA